MTDLQLTLDFEKDMPDFEEVVNAFTYTTVMDGDGLVSAAVRLGPIHVVQQEGESIEDFHEYAEGVLIGFVLDSDHAKDLVKTINENKRRKK